MSVSSKTRKTRSALLSSALMALLALASPGMAHASEQSELIACLASLAPYSDGTATDITPGEHGTQGFYPTVMVPGERNKMPGLYVFSEDKSYFIPAPSWKNKDQVNFLDIEFSVPGEKRGKFSCHLLHNTGEKFEPYSIRCPYDESFKMPKPTFEELQWMRRNSPNLVATTEPAMESHPFHFDPVKLIPVPARERPERFLKTEVTRRVLSTMSHYTRSLGLYEEGKQVRLACSERYTGIAGAFKQFADNFTKHYPQDPPFRSNYIRALNQCKTEDEPRHTDVNSTIYQLGKLRSYDFMLEDPRLPKIACPYE